MIPKNLSFLDVETTGVSPTKDRIIEIGIVRVEDGKIKDTYQSLFDPQSHIPPEITRITGITSKHLENAPTFRQEKDRVDEILNDSVIVAHNARFDTGFLKAEYTRLDDRFTLKHLCTARLSRNLFPRFRRHNLDSIIERFSLSCEPRHRAYPDALVLWDFFRALLENYNTNKLENAIKAQLKRPALPSSINPKIIDDLPEKPGVYLFYDKEGSPLYVGKSINIHNRVLTHFYSDYKNTKDFSIAHQVTHIEGEETAGELEALLREKQLISKLQPLYNRRLRESKSLIAVLSKKTKEGYDSIEMRSSSEIDVKDISNILAVFRTKAQAKRALIDLSNEHNLCQKLLGLEKSKGTCFGYQIQKCFGACVKKENTLKYNLRFCEAFAKTKIRQWPFPGPIVIPEGDVGHLVYRWCYLGVFNGSDDENIGELLGKLQFDYDTYKILVNHILQTKHSNKIKVLKNYEANFSV